MGVREDEVRNLHGPATVMGLEFLVLATVLKMGRPPNALLRP
jgi:hypothetical protein